MHKVILRKYSVFGETISEKEIMVEQASDIYVYNGEYYTYCSYLSLGEGGTLYRNVDEPVVIEGE